MRRLIGLASVLALLWCGWWWLASTAVERGVLGWLSARQAEGWRADVETLGVTGFPLTLAARLDGIALRDPQGGTGLEATSLEVSVPAYWPGDMTLRLPDTPITLSSPAGTMILRARDAISTVNLHPGPALVLEAATATSAAWQINTKGGNLLSGNDFDGALRQLADAPTRYRLTLNADEIAPGDLVRAAFSIPDDWPATFNVFAADIHAGFDAPLDRHALEDRLPALREARIDALRVNWGPLMLSASGGVTIDAAGIPTGRLDLLVENWREIIGQAEASGVINSTQRTQAEFFLSALANRGDDPDTLDLALRFAEGQVFLGPISLGPAPRVVWP